MRDFRDYFQNLTELGLSAPDLPAKALDWGDVDPSCLEDDAHPLVYLVSMTRALLDWPV